MALFPNPIVDVLRPTVYTRLVLVTDITVGDSLTSDPFIPVKANMPPPAYAGGAALTPLFIIVVTILKLRLTASWGI